MSDWLKLKDVPAGTPRSPGVLFNVIVSPYEIPDATRGFKSPNGKFRIEFRYIDGPEPEDEVNLDKFVTALQGRHSRRLLALEVDIDALGAESVGVAFLQVIEKKIDAAWKRVVAQSPPDQTLALEEALQAFKTREPEVLSQLAAHH